TVVDVTEPCCMQCTIPDEIPSDNPKSSPLMISRFTRRSFRLFSVLALISSSDHCTSLLFASQQCGSYKSAIVAVSRTTNRRSIDNSLQRQRPCGLNCRIEKHIFVVFAVDRFRRQDNTTTD